MASMSLNRVMLIGRVGKDPELKQNKCSFTIATDASYTDRDGVRQVMTDWHNVSCFGKTIEIVQNYVHKGSMVYVEGSVSTRKYTDQNGNQKQFTEVKAQRVMSLDQRPRDNGYAPTPDPLPQEQIPQVQEEQDNVPF